MARFATKRFGSVRYFHVDVEAGVTSTGAQTVPSVTQTGGGILIPSGTGVQALFELLQSGVGAERFTSVGAQALSELLQSGAGLLVPSGVGVQTLFELLQSGVSSLPALVLVFADPIILVLPTDQVSVASPVDRVALSISTDPVNVGFPGSVTIVTPR